MLGLLVLLLGAIPAIDPESEGTRADSVLWNGRGNLSVERGVKAPRPLSVRGSFNGGRSICQRLIQG